uniref:Uncharacterized protein n=1 Tax=Anguilla anguilla TaxID=7936 RepID=A0A0E9V1M6_ANGAN
MVTVNTPQPERGNGGNIKQQNNPKHYCKDENVNTYLTPSEKECSTLLKCHKRSTFYNTASKLYSFWSSRSVLPTVVVSMNICQYNAALKTT